MSFDINEFMHTNYNDSITHPFKNMVEKFDIGIAGENLTTCCRVLDEMEFSYRILFGTLLGLYRNGEIIEHDTDVDIAISVEDIHLAKSLISKLEGEGFKVVRYEKNHIFSLERNGVYVDFYIFRGFNGELACGDYKIPLNSFAQYSIIEYRGHEIKALENPENFFLKYYGRDWETPIKNLHAAGRNAKR